MDSVRAEPGQDVSLQCSSSSDAAITLLEWKRSGLEEDSVFYFRDNKPIESIQDPRYRGRVQLSDPEMKNGDASVLLKNVDIEDTGTYECRVITLSNNRRKRNVGELVSSVHLTVSEGPKKPEGPEKEINDEQPGGSRGHVGLGVGAHYYLSQVTGISGAHTADTRCSGPRQGYRDPHQGYRDPHQDYKDPIRIIKTPVRVTKTPAKTPIRKTTSLRDSLIAHLSCTIPSSHFVKAEPGQDVSLQCSSSSDAAITLLEWERSGLEGYVFYFRDNKLIESIQDPRYRGRVQLSDPEMKNGDASVLLKNVDIEDTGTYECWVILSPITAGRETWESWFPPSI
ncbi:hypothetical protein KUCAC02_023602 [Chaenocephalus aceratus]|nr:hypothetical protein KUCAC02_023602 [Chaenocephalus aceratus]